MSKLTYQLSFTTPYSDEEFVIPDNISKSEELCAFTTFRTRRLQNGLAVYGLEEHLKRLNQSCSTLNLPTAKHGQITSDLAKYLPEAQSTLKSDDLRIRITAHPRGHYIQIGELIAKKTNSTLGAVKARRELPEHKTSRCEVCYRACKSVPADEALLYDKFVREGAWSNIFWFEGNGKLYTNTRLALPGVTQNAIIRLYGAETREITLDDLLSSATEVFISRSTNGIVSVTNIDGATFSNKRTQQLIKEFAAEVTTKSTIVL